AEVPAAVEVATLVVPGVIALVVPRVLALVVALVIASVLALVVPGVVALVVAGLAPRLVALVPPAAAVPTEATGERVEEQQAAEAAGPTGQRALPPRLGVPAGRDRSALHPPARVVVRGVAARPGGRAVLAALHVQLPVLGDHADAALPGQRWEVRTRV